MSQLIFAPIGTSIINNYLDRPEERILYRTEIEGNPPEDKHVSNEFLTLKQSILSRLQQGFDHSILNFANETKNQLSAEIITLHIMCQNSLINPANDAIAMLYSHTLDGKLAAELNKEIVMEKLKFSNIQLYQLNNINGKDGETFTEMVNNKSISNLLDNISTSFHNIQKCLFCFSGGYKGLIPIISDYANKHSSDMYCLFERSNSLIQYKFSYGGIAETFAYRDTGNRNRRL